MGKIVKYYTIKEVAKNNGKDGARIWIIIKDIVYDLTDYVKEHPGGTELITECSGMDATVGFDDYGHSMSAQKQLKIYQIGELVEEDRKSSRKKKQININMQESQSRRTFLAALCGGCIT